MERQLKHLEFVQGVVNRLAANSFRIKGWSVVLVSALFVLAAREGRIAFSFIVLVPLALLWALDGYYLWQERLFRALYDHVRSLDECKIDFSMDVTPFTGSASIQRRQSSPPITATVCSTSPSVAGNRPRTWRSSIFSKTLIIFYVALNTTVFLAVAIYLIFNGVSS